MCEQEKWYAFRPWRRHSLVLLIGGLVYIGIGISFITLSEITVRRETSLVIALRIASMHSWGVLFVLAGALSILSARWPAISDSWGYAVLTGLASAWAAIYFFGFFMGGAPFSNIISGLVWWLIAFMWWAISGLLNPDRRLVVRHDRD